MLAVENRSAPAVRKRQRFLWLCVMALLLLATWLGARGLNADAIWYDEYWSLDNAGGTHDGPYTLAQTVDTLATSSHERNPPLYYLMLNLWGHAAGWSDVMVRALSLFIGLLGIALGYRMGRDIISPLGGLVIAAGLGASAFYVYYMHEARPYILTPPLLALVLWAYWRAVNGRAGILTQMALSLSIAALLWAHYLALIPLAALGLYHLIFAPKTRLWWRVSILMALGGLAFLPWTAKTVDVADNEFSRAARDLANLNVGGTLAAIAYGFDNGVVPFALVGLSGLLALRERQRGAIFVVFMALAGLAAALLLNAVWPFISHIRYLIELLPLWLLLLALGVAQLRLPRRALALLFAVWIAAGVWNSVNPAFAEGLFRATNAVFFRPDLPLDKLADTVGAQMQDGDAVAFYTPQYGWALAGPFDYYMYPLGVRYAMLDAFPGDTANGEYAGQVRNFMGDSLRVWLGVEQGDEDAHLTAFRQALTDGGYTQCQNGGGQWPMLALELYTRAQTCCLPSTSSQIGSLIAYNNGVALAQVDALPAQAQGTLPVIMAWSLSDDVPRETYSVGLHVMDAAGNLAAQADYGLPGRAFQCHEALVDISTLPPGEYTVQVILYAWQTGERITGTLNATGEQVDTFVVGSFVVRY
jgi:hypothetical protein